MKTQFYASQVEKKIAFAQLVSVVGSNMLSIFQNQVYLFFIEMSPRSRSK